MGVVTKVKAPRFKEFQSRGRFFIEREGDETWQVVDEIDGTLIGFQTKREAEEAATFARDYVRRHGDIDFLSFPYSWDQALSYCNRQSTELEILLEVRPWTRNLPEVLKMIEEDQKYS